MTAFLGGFLWCGINLICHCHFGNDGDDFRKKICKIRKKTGYGNLLSVYM